MEEKIKVETKLHRVKCQDCEWIGKEEDLIQYSYTDVKCPVCGAKQSKLQDLYVDSFKVVKNLFFGVTQDIVKDFLDKKESEDLLKLLSNDAYTEYLILTQ